MSSIVDRVVYLSRRFYDVDKLCRGSHFIDQHDFFPFAPPPPVFWKCSRFLTSRAIFRYDSFDRRQFDDRKCCLYIGNILYTLETLSKRHNLKESTKGVDNVKCQQTKQAVNVLKLYTQPKKRVSESQLVSFVQLWLYHISEGNPWATNTAYEFTCCFLFPIHIEQIKPKNFLCVCYVVEANRQTT